MAKRKQRRRRSPVATVEYTDPEGNVLSLRASLSAPTIDLIRREAGRPAASQEDVRQRRLELCFERLAARWEIAGLPLTDQAMLLGRYRMADTDTRRWVQRTLNEHVAAHIPALDR